MLLQERMKEIKFSPNEQLVVEFILEKQEKIEEYSTRTIAEATYTSPSVLIRIANKLDFDGWNTFKEAFLKEVNYLQSNFKDLDANLPFDAGDSMRTIANKIAQLKTESIKDTISLLDDSTLEQAVKILDQSRSIKVFGISNTLFLGEEFVHKMRHLNKQAEIFTIHNTLFQEAAMTSLEDCAVCISYSGESGELLEVANILKKNKVPIIALTSLGENSLSTMADVTLRVTTREKSYSKIAGFTSLESISLLLDILYSAYFSLRYDENYSYKLRIAESTEVRSIQNRMVQEE